MAAMATPAARDQAHSQSTMSRRRRKIALTVNALTVAAAAASACVLFSLRRRDGQLFRLALPRRTPSHPSSSDLAYEVRNDNGRRLVGYPIHRRRRSSGAGPHAVWLMSFPNSGTSYTILNTQRLTNTSAASNYGGDMNSETGEPLRIRPDVDYSPFMLKPDRTVPNLVLTKTHCTGYCDDCRSLLVGLDEFVTGCSETRVNSVAKRQPYSAAVVVAKAVHLFRDPFDNLVSRKHLGVQIRQRRNSSEWATGSVVASDTPEGLLAWCRFIDESVIDLATGWSRLPSDFQKLFRSLPCASDLFRYVQWHNRAIETTRWLQLPVHYMHYEDYSEAYEETVMGLLDFLELNMTRSGFAVAMPFEARNKSYRNLFRHGNFSMTAMAAFLRRLATNETWQHLRRYVDGWYDEAKQADADSSISD